MATPAQAWLQLAAKSVMNALSDHYIKTRTPLTEEEYWKTHLKLTPSTTVNSWVQAKVSKVANPALDSIDDVVSRIKKELGI
jgi:hypothetical protein